jgi:polar amino acid transport system substrate-binding protein
VIRAVIVIVFITLGLFIKQAVSSDKSELRSGWYQWNPYQYSQATDRREGLIGLDIQLSREIMAAMHKKIMHHYVSWKQQLLNIRDGTQDIAMGATYTDERAKYAWFSVPYRFEENSLFVKRHRLSEFRFGSVKEMLQAFTEKKHRVGVIDGFIYADPRINEWIADPRHQSQIVRVPDDTYNIENLLTDHIDCFLADRISGATVILQGNYGQEVTEVALNIRTPIHFMLSKKTISPQFVAALNQSITTFQRTEKYLNLMAWALYPVFLLQTIDTDWFRLIDYLGTIAFAISGLVIAYRDRATLFGAFIFALLPSMGGGIIRDVIFNRKPVGALQTPVYLLLVIFTVLIGYLLLRIIGRYTHDGKFDRFMRSENKWVQYILVICDGLGLAAFTVSGIIVSILAKVSPLWLWGAFFSFITGAGGGILRDLLSKERFIISISGTNPYAEISVIWGFFLAIFLHYQARIIDPDMIKIAVITTVIGAFLTRMFVYIFNVPNIYFTVTSSPRVHHTSAKENK